MAAHGRNEQSILPRDILVARIRTLEQQHPDRATAH
jgi:hypothetical protein